jgi:hypothetical protein
MLQRFPTLVAVALFAGTATVAGAEMRFLGAIAGQVKAPNGGGQMGASVLLLNHYERPIQKAITDAEGRFRFESLLPDYYSVRVSQATFVTAARDRILVKAGLESFLTIQMAAFLSTIELVYQSPGQSGLLADDWKWVLRSSSATRPVLRFGPNLDPSLPGSTRSSNLFSATRGVVRVSAGDSGGSSYLGNEPDLGTAFALATSVYGANELSFSGNFGYASSVNAPAAGFRTRFSRTGESAGLAPNVELTVRQLAVRARVGQALLGGPGNMQAMPTLRTMSAKVEERVKLTDDISLDYGLNLESVVFIERLNYLSPFARLSYDLGRAGMVEVGYSSGLPPLDLLTSSGGPDLTMQQTLSGLAVFPRVSLRNGRARVQRSNNLEVGYTKSHGSRIYSVAVYEDRITDFALTVAAPAGLFDGDDLLPDIASNSSIFNLGGLRSRGFMTGLTQNFWNNWSAGVAYGMGGALTLMPGGSAVEEAADLRTALRSQRQQWVAARINGVIPGAGTRFTTAYVWTPVNSLLPAHAYLTQRLQPQAGLNMQVRQPLPGIGLVPGRWEMTAELRNLLSQGYVPLAALDGRQIVLIQFPKTVRGGLSFIF